MLCSRKERAERAERRFAYPTAEDSWVSAHQYMKHTYEPQEQALIDGLRRFGKIEKLAETKEDMKDFRALLRVCAQKYKSGEFPYPIVTTEEPFYQHAGGASHSGLRFTCINQNHVF